jgi:hypothetical protein
MRFEILDEIFDIETFATGSRIREIARLQATSLKAKPWQDKGKTARCMHRQ